MTPEKELEQEDTSTTTMVDEPKQLTAVKDQLSPEDKVLVEEMIEAGVLFGRKHSRTNPKMNKFIFSTRRGIDLIDLMQTKDLLDEAGNFLKEKIEEGGTILVVSTKANIKDQALEFIEKYKLPYVTERWLGGTLTNFKTINKRVDRLRQLRIDKESGELDKYTKKERLMMDRQLEKLERLFGGIESMDSLPAVLLVFDVDEHETAIREAIRMNIPIVGLINTDGDPRPIKYPIPCNDNARSSIGWVLGKLEVKLDQAKPTIAKEEKEEESKKEEEK
jgi:small subunit ribosomal protein S2